MALTLTTPNTVLGVLSPKSQSARLALNIVTVVLGSLLLALSAMCIGMGVDRAQRARAEA